MSREKAHAARFNLPLIFGITLFGVMGVAIITPAFPVIQAEFNLTSGQIGLLITVFTLPAVLLTPILGVVADRLGRRRILAASLVLFGLAGGLCGLARDYDTLLILRLFQGIGAAALGSLNITVIGDLYGGTKRAGVMGMNASVLSIGTATYPLLGGALATLAWFYPFFLAFLAIPLGFLVLFFLKNPEPAADQKLGDYLAGAWKGIRNGQVLAIFAIGILTFIILFGAISTSLSLMLGRDFAASSFEIGLIMFTMSLSTATVASQLGRLSRRFRRDQLLIFGFSCYGVAMILIAISNNLWLFILPLLIFGMGHGMTLPVLQTLLAEKAPLEYRAIFMSLNGAMLRIGQSLGPVVIGLAFALPNHRWAFYIGFSLSMLAVLIIIFGIARRPVHS